MNKKKFETIEALESFLNKIPKFSTSGISAANFSLESMMSLISLFGNPHKAFPSIHVAGTNGKGTVCQMLASVYQEAGYKTGIYTSPHLIRVNERFKVNGENIPDEKLLNIFNRYSDVISERSPTFFELTTAIAFRYFADHEVDIAIIETGLGGRLDATNIIDPVASVITSVGMDHTDVLGDSISKIAREKAGIIKQNRPVIVGNLSKEAFETVAKIAENKESILYKAVDLRPQFKDGKFELSDDDHKVTISASSRKRTDAVNAAVVYQTVKSIQDQFIIDEQTVIKGIETVDLKFPYHAHFEKLVQDRNWYFDGAHNAEAVDVLIDELKSRAPVSDWLVVLSFMKDKLNDEIASKWMEFPKKMLYAQSGERAAGLSDMLKYFPDSVELSGSETEIIHLLERDKSELVIFSGSFYFYSKVRQWTGT